METSKKYKLTDETIQVDGHTLHRIEALTYFSDVYKGDKGGFVESEENLSQEGDCWVYDNAKVYDNARVFDNAKVYCDVSIYGNAGIYGDAIIYDRAGVYGNARVFDKAIVYDNAEVYDNVEVYDDAEVGDNARVCGDAIIYGKVVIRGDAKIESASDYIVFKNWWSSGRYFTWTRSNNRWKVGCFYGTGEELIEKAYKDSKLSGREYKRVVKYVESILKDNENDKR